ncbi:hypothetical protein SBA1_590021 [Candidatus Sulfotelmatobacter kueseliae]|uniref:Uncharacterized protein n=1 Tax=Candidatus Sulfotelmatobacter kueseliae TaxID=2042962 RepID=A0A2U3L0D9_9BACT|nr:hypothetical protein SBA1_590021 [Candidatus Sulfotelmatobacter kueseliae]
MGRFDNFALLSLSGQAKTTPAAEILSEAMAPFSRHPSRFAYLIEITPTRLPQPLWDAKTWVDDVSSRLL